MIEQPPQKTPASGGKKGRAGQTIGWLISLACIAFVASRLDLESLERAFHQLDGAWIVVGVAGLTFGYAMRIVRWASLLRAGGATIRTIDCAAPFLGSIALNNVLPLRAGDVVRALVFPGRLGVRRTTAAASLLLERLVDLAALVLCLGVGLALIGSHVELPSRVERVVVVASIGTSAGLLLMLWASPWIGGLLAARADRTGPGGVIGRFLRIGSSLFEGIAEMSRPKVLLWVAVVSIPVWVGEAGLYYALMKGLGVRSDVAGALTVMAVTTLSTLVPSTPGYVGPFHLAAFAAVSLIGSDAAQAGAFAILTHFTLWAATTLAGALAMVFRRDLFAGLP